MGGIAINLHKHQRWPGGEIRGWRPKRGPDPGAEDGGERAFFFGNLAL